MVVCNFAFLCSLGIRYESRWFLPWFILIVTPGWLFFVRVYEEKELEIRFGEPYIKYRALTPFFWPRPPVGDSLKRQALGDENVLTSRL